MSRRLVIIVLAALAEAACLQKIDEGAAKGNPKAIQTPALDTPPIELPGGGTTHNPCDRTSPQAQIILRTYCAGCHGGEAPSEDKGHPPFDFVLDLARLTTTRCASVPDPHDPSQGMLFVAPGDPESSRIYLRMRDNEMPPTPLGGTDPLPRPSISEVSVMYTWIKNCVSP